MEDALGQRFLMKRVKPMPNAIGRIRSDGRRQFHVAHFLGKMPLTRITQRAAERATSKLLIVRLSGATVLGQGVQRLGRTSTSHRRLGTSDLPGGTPGHKRVGHLQVVVERSIRKD